MGGDSITLPDGYTRSSFQLPGYKRIDQQGNLVYAAYSQVSDFGLQVLFCRQPLAASTPLADLNRDGEVNLLDLNLVLRGMSEGPNSSIGDVDFDGRTTFNDLQMLLDQWGNR